MKKKRWRRENTPGPGKTGPRQTVDEMVAELKGAGRPESDYRKRSLAIHGLICAKCAREFDEGNKHLLTVHHKDGDHRNNPADGSNWENLCAYCHEDEHSRGMLGDFLSRHDHE
jgi:HNH endonuclease